MNIPTKKGVQDVMVGCFGHNCLCAGQEFPLLAAAFPEHDVVGIDLAQGMVDLAEQVIKEKGLRCDCGDMLLWGWRGIRGHRGSLVRGPRLVGGGLERHSSFMN